MNRECRRRERRKNLGFEDVISKKFPKKTRKMKSHQTHWLTKGSFFARLGTKNDISESRAPKARAKKKIGLLGCDFKKFPQKNSKNEKSPNALAHEMVIFCAPWEKNDTSESRAQKARAKKKFGLWGCDLKEFPQKNSKNEKSPNTLAHGRVIIAVTWDKK